MDKLTWCIIDTLGPVKLERLSPTGKFYVYFMGVISQQSSSLTPLHTFRVFGRGPSFFRQLFVVGDNYEESNHSLPLLEVI